MRPRQAEGEEPRSGFGSPAARCRLSQGTRGSRCEGLPFRGETLSLQATPAQGGFTRLARPERRRRRRSPGRRLISPVLNLTKALSPRALSLNTLFSTSKSARPKGCQTSPAAAQRGSAGRKHECRARVRSPRRLALRRAAFAAPPAPRAAALGSSLALFGREPEERNRC